MLTNRWSLESLETLSNKKLTECVNVLCSLKITHDIYESLLKMLCRLLASTQHITHLAGRGGRARTINGHDYRLGKVPS